MNLLVALFYVVGGILVSVPSTTLFYSVQALAVPRVYLRQVPSSLTTNCKTTTFLTSSLHVEDGGLSKNNDNNVADGDDDGAAIPTKSAAFALSTESSLAQVESLTVQTLGGDVVKLGDVLKNANNQQQQSTNARKNPGQAVVLSCLSHYGDYNAWELTQQYMTAVRQGRLDDGCPIVLVGIGSVEAARVFATDVGLVANKDGGGNQQDNDDAFLNGKIMLVTDETGSVTEALSCYRGWLTVDQKHKQRFKQTDVPAAFKLMGMIFGFGSPGTIVKVLDGYVGDWNDSKGLFGRSWVVEALVRGGKKGRFPKVPIEVDENLPLQPFELATLRFQTGLHILSKWHKLGPKNEDLITRMGGAF